MLIQMQKDYVFPLFICDLTGRRISGKHVATVLMNTGRYILRDAVLNSPTSLCQDVVRVEAGTSKNVRYYIDFNAEDYIAVCNTQYATDDQTAWDNASNLMLTRAFIWGAASMQVMVYDADSS